MSLAVVVLLVSVVATAVVAVSAVVAAFGCLRVLFFFACLVRLQAQ